MRLFDLHCDTLGLATDGGFSIEENPAAVDLCRGGWYERWTQTFAAWLPDGMPVPAARRRCEALLDTADRFVRETTSFHPVACREDLCSDGLACRAVLSVENGGALAADAGYLTYLFQRGVRLMGLTWNGANAWGCGCLGDDGGLTPAGRQAMTTLERLSVTVDVSHLNETGFWQVAEQATRPFVATHSNAAAVCPHPRNLTDAQFCAIRDAGGIVGINLYGEHLGGWDFPAFQRHVEHFLSLDGEQTVCVGTDLDGMEIPPGWDGISVIKEIRQYLAGEGYPDTLLDAVFYRNAFSFFEKALLAKS